MHITMYATKNKKDFYNFFLNTISYKYISIFSFYFFLSFLLFSIFLVFFNNYRLIVHRTVFFSLTE